MKSFQNKKFLRKSAHLVNATLDKLDSNPSKSYFSGIEWGHIRRSNFTKKIFLNSNVIIYGFTYLQAFLQIFDYLDFGLWTIQFDVGLYPISSLYLSRNSL